MFDVSYLNMSLLVKRLNEANLFFYIKHSKKNQRFLILTNYERIEIKYPALVKTDIIRFNCSNSSTLAFSSPDTII
jgi:hypothetical protein